MGVGSRVAGLFCCAADVEIEDAAADGGESGAEELVVGDGGVDFGDSGVVVAHDLGEFEGVVAVFAELIGLVAGVGVLDGVGFAEVGDGLFEDLGGGGLAAEFGAGGGGEAGGGVVEACGGGGGGLVLPHGLHLFCGDVGGFCGVAFESVGACVGGFAVCEALCACLCGLLGGVG